jgi:hypothetical protein
LAKTVAEFVPTNWPPVHTLDVTTDAIVCLFRQRALRRQTLQRAFLPISSKGVKSLARGSPQSKPHTQ